MNNSNFYTQSRMFVMPLLLSVLSLAFSASALAGMDVTGGLTGSCYQSGTTEVCYGTMAGIRNQSGEPGRYAVFGYTSAGTSYFYMAVNGAGYYCSAPSSLNDTIKTAMASSGYFMIQYNINT